MLNIAIIGSGPTAIYTAAYLLAQKGLPFALTIFEAQAQAGKGTPYHPGWNDKAMLSNIASIEIPAITETLETWLRRQTDAALAAMDVSRETIDERAFFPRVVLGEYFENQLQQLCAEAEARGIAFAVRTGQRVVDAKVLDEGIQLSVATAEGTLTHSLFSHVVIATGHVWPERTELRPGYFTSPWPASALGSIGQCRVGIRGTSLSAIDAVVALASARGHFSRDDAAGMLRYHPAKGTQAFDITLMSRKGLLPEADFYHTIPYEPLSICTPEAVGKLVAEKRPDLLDAVFDLFKRELTACDPVYVRDIGLAELTLERFCRVYFHEREEHDPFEWAAMNLSEAKRNHARAHTVPWRYAILRMHEVVGDIVPHLSAEDHARFTRHFKTVFVDDYATVPHESIERLLALKQAGKLSIMQIGEEYMLDTDRPEGGALLAVGDQKIHFPAFIEAIGQKSLSVRDFPFPSLRRQGVVRNATAPHRIRIHAHASSEIGGIALDRHFHPITEHPNAAQLYCLSLPFMLSQFPFAQGITSSEAMAKIVVDDMVQSTASEAKMPVTHWKPDAPEIPLLATLH